ncbi:P-loop containing nucleoside triphosphate hydrolase protein [Penicillium robsamsonii]|uniref:P-loop containing nucleoside triphosphate hydrolase protein n=1 Tax=Penicillium robsamsonii TaxID=1792511 RepID=UPI0025490D55|nr:P-loop containing nucleoside triphosphate hydrolase protein [Penicillium robsamsonii]KAJ5817755.1 P-loop containing nucleoside triphosphate hydrolase protein [Penicillium robsamsonii]
MTVSTEASLASALGERLLFLEKQFSELQQKYNLLSDVKESSNEIKSKPSETTEANEKSSPKSRVKLLKRVNNPATGEREELESDSPQSNTEGNPNIAFVLKKTIPEKFSGADDTSEIDIINLNLWELLKEHLGGYPYHVFRGSPVTLFSPYEAIIFKWDALQIASIEEPKNEQDKQAREDLKLLLDHISNSSSGDSKLDKYFKERNTTIEYPKIQFDDLWTIFPPGTLVYGRPFQNQHQVFIVQDNMGTWPEETSNPKQLQPWRLSCWTYDFTGVKFERTAYVIVFEPYEGYKPLPALPYYPFKHHPEHDRVKEELISRGKEFEKLCSAQNSPCLFDYKGDAIFGRKGFSGMTQGDEDDSDIKSFAAIWGLRKSMRSSSAEETPLFSAKASDANGRVMVDYLSYFEYGNSNARNGGLERSSMDPPCVCFDCRNNQELATNYRDYFDHIEEQNKLDDEQYLLCPPRVLGYILKEKQWAQLQVTLIKDIPKVDPEDAWSSRLQLADGMTKDLLFDLVQSHTSSASRTEEHGLEVDDIIPGKGKGLVILLYGTTLPSSPPHGILVVLTIYGGPPGVGKTSTAETIAVATRKPLFSVSVADVGTQAKHVESNLSRIFSLATTWQAILLIDEADVFLEARGRGASSSTDKNALVSVFLRVLEYYQGIVFLTTNQIAQFDIAIPSRIHLAIQYKSLKPEQMKAIFKGFLQPLEDKGLVDDLDEILDWLQEDVYNLGFDGRQIRNIVTTALGLARAEFDRGKGRGRLSKKHIKPVVQNVRMFKTDFTVQYDRYIRSQESMIKM